jgi:hypothetical protein
MVCSPNFVSISMVKNIKINLEKLKRKEKKKESIPSIASPLF